MEIIKKAIEQIPVLEVHGQIDLSNCYLLHEAIIDEVEAGNYHLVINLHKISYIDSSCLGVLLGGLERVKKNGGGLAVVGNPLVDRVLTLTGLTRVFPFHSTVNDALENIKKTKDQL
ncbi:MAG TPA: STAS domain-containing protein [Anaerolineae bacterium]|jgi:anti-sigma B factor antagonist|nr:STAS domain-containing protein [Anaerolineae bacterium]